MKNDSSDVRFFSARTLWGLLAGIFTSLIFIIFFKQSGLYTPILSLIAASWISKLYQPKHLAGLGAVIGIPAGFVVGIQVVLYEMQTVDLAALMGAYITASLFFIVYVLSFIFTGFCYGQIIKLYRRGALF